MISKSRKIKKVEKVLTFDVDRDILTDPRSVLGEKVENHELTIISYKSRAAREKTPHEARQFPEFSLLAETFSCALMDYNKDRTELSDILIICVSFKQYY